jgi:CheY-like chemotaxis protein
MMMPNMSGRAFYERLLMDHPTLAPKVVFLTGGATCEDGDPFLSAVPNLSVRKPIFGDALRKLVQRRL